MSAIRIIIVAVLASFFAAGCGSGTQNTQPPSSRETSSTAITETPDDDIANDADKSVSGDLGVPALTTPGNDTADDSSNNDSDNDSGIIGGFGDASNDGPAPNPAETSDSPPITQVADEFGPNTTANPADEKAIDLVATKIVEAWWTPDEATTYGELATALENQSLINKKLASEWREQGDQPVVAAPDDTAIVRMWPVRVDADNATFQISALAEGEEDETLTFIEFELEDGLWKASGIE